MPYAAPRSLDDALTLLAKTEGAIVLAGGHTLLVEPHRSTLGDRLLVDLARVPKLAGIAKEGKGLRMGAMTTLSDVAGDATVRKLYGVLVQAIEGTGDPQMRNRATVGGSLASDDADNDFPAMAVILDASIEITGAKGPRVVAADDFFSGKAAPGRGEIITAMLLPPREPRTGLAYEAQRNPATLKPICGVGVGIDLAPDGTIAASRVVLVGATDQPKRLRHVEQRLAGTRGQDAIGAAAFASEGLTMRTDLFASADYRKHLARVLTERAVKQALERAGG